MRRNSTENLPIADEKQNSTQNNEDEKTRAAEIREPEPIPDETSAALSESCDFAVVNSMSLADAAEWYAQRRIRITPLLPHLKKAYIKEWNTPEVAIRFREHAVVRAHWHAHPDDNIGMVLEPSNVIVFDIDHLATTKEVFAALGLEGVLTTPTAGVRSGRANHAKLVFLAPDGVKLEHHVLKATVDGVEDDTIFELRAGMIQDVLPPSIHPEGGKYQWVGPEPITILPPPKDLIGIWQNWSEWEAVLKEIVEGRTHPAPTPTTKPVSSVKKKMRYGHTIVDLAEAWNDSHNITAELLRCGCRATSNPMRFDRPDCKESDSGVVVLSLYKFFVHNTKGNFFNDGRPHSAWDIFVEFDHHGDKAAACKAAEIELGFEPTKNVDVKAVAENGALISAGRIEKVERNRRMLLGMQDEPPTAEAVQKSKVFEGYRIGDDGIAEFHVKGHMTLRGHLAEMAKFCLETAVVPRPITAWIATTMFAAAVCGRHFCFQRRVYSLLYMCCFAESGTGKNDIKNCIRALAFKVGCMHLVAEGDGWTSDSGVHSSIVLSPQSVACWDEMGAMLKKMVGGNDRVAASAMTELTKQYTSADTTFQAKKFAEHPNPHPDQGYELEEVAKYQSIKRPCMSVMGMGVPSDMQVITEELIETGAMARWLFLEIGREPYHVSEMETEPAIKADTVNYIREILLIYGSDPHADPGDIMIHLAPYDKWTKPIRMSLSPDSPKTWEDYFNQQMDESYVLENESERALKNRELEIASRLAIPMAILGSPECEVALKDIIEQKKRKQLRDSSLQLKTEEILKEMDIFSGDDVPELIKAYKHNENQRKKWENYRDYSVKKQAHDEWETAKKPYVVYEELQAKHNAEIANYNEYLQKLDKWKAWSLKTDEEKAQEEHPEKPTPVKRPPTKGPSKPQGKFTLKEPELPPAVVEMPQAPEPEPPTDEEKAEFEAACEVFERRKQAIAEIKALECLEREAGVTTKGKYKEIQIPAAVFESCIEETNRSINALKALWSKNSAYSERSKKQARKAAEYIYDKIIRKGAPYVFLAEVKSYLKEEGLQISGKKFDGKTEYIQILEQLETEYGYCYRKEAKAPNGRGYFYDGTAIDAQAKMEEFDDMVRVAVKNGRMQQAEMPTQAKK